MFIKINNLDTNKPLEKSYLLMENFSMASPIACYGNIGTAKSGLVTKKRELPKTSLYISHSD